MTQPDDIPEEMRWRAAETVVLFPHGFKNVAATGKAISLVARAIMAAEKRGEERERDACAEAVAVKADGHQFGWKCNCCTTVFTAAQETRHESHACGGANCPRCKAHGQYTYRYDLHDGDPCKKCGISHDDVPVGPCNPELNKVMMVKK